MLAAFLILLLALPATFIFLYLKSFLPANDFYTKILILAYKRLLFGRRKPTARTDMRVQDIRPKRDLTLVPISE